MENQLKELQDQNPKNPVTVKMLIDLLYPLIEQAIQKRKAKRALKKNIK
jgi:hypothetical protein